MDNCYSVDFEMNKINRKFLSVYCGKSWTGREKEAFQKGYEISEAEFKNFLINNANVQNRGREAIWFGFVLQEWMKQRTPHEQDQGASHVGEGE